MIQADCFIILRAFMFPLLTYNDVCHAMTLVTCSPMDPQQWMGAVRMRVQTADKNITIIHKQSTPFHRIMSCEAKSCVCNKQIHHWDIFNFKPLLPAKIPLSIILLSPVKMSARLNQERNMHRSKIMYKWKQSNRDLNKHVGGFWWREQQLWKDN